MNDYSRLASLVLASVMIWNLPSTVLADDNGPWMIGPLLAQPGHTVPAGHFDYEPYFFATNTFGVYDNHWHAQNVPNLKTLNPLAEVSYGINSFSDIIINVPYYYNSTQNRSGQGIGDVNFVLGFQVMNSQPNTWIPDCRFTVMETFPTGKYEGLDPGRFGADGIGNGYYSTDLGLNFQRMVELSGGHYLSARLTFSYLLPGNVHVENFNRYGGTIGTNGTIRAGNQFSTDLGLEYTLTKNWVPALDIVYNSFQDITFSGNPGVTSLGLPAPIGAPSSEQISLAPALEYNFNASWGVIGGVWFTIAGRSTPQFVSGVFALNYYV